MLSCLRSFTLRRTAETAGHRLLLSYLSSSTHIKMKIKPSGPIEQAYTSEMELIDSSLSLNGKRILDLGCGAARLTRLIACAGSEREILALEVDETQHKKNLMIDDLPNVRFELAGAEAIPAKDASHDFVFMFKSLHHVPCDLMDKAFAEIHRVLKPGGILYISEPIFDGDFNNNLLRLFHDEENVRQKAFEATERAVKPGYFDLKEEIFFKLPRIYQNFEEFEERTINVTHTHHSLDDALMERIKKVYLTFADETGKAEFEDPMRVDMLLKSK